jgi:hypothetical protein
MARRSSIGRASCGHYFRLTVVTILVVLFFLFFFFLVDFFVTGGDFFVVDVTLGLVVGAVGLVVGGVLRVVRAPACVVMLAFVLAGRVLVVPDFVVGPGAAVVTGSTLSATFVVAPLWVVGGFVPSIFGIVGAVIVGSTGIVGTTKVIVGSTGVDCGLGSETDGVWRGMIARLGDAAACVAIAPRLTSVTTQLPQMNRAVRRRTCPRSGVMFFRFAMSKP